MRPFPSFVIKQMVPLSVTAKLQPLIPICAPRNRRRSSPRAVAHMTAASRVGSIPNSRSKTLATSSARL